MKKIIFIFLIYFTVFNVHSQEQFNFDVTEIQITEDGNKFIGKNKGKITSDSGIIIIADKFEYNKKTNILNATGNVEINDTINKYLIYSKKIIYDKNNGLIFTKENSKAISSIDNIIITAKNFDYNINKNSITANENVILENKKVDYKIFSELITYLRNDEKIYTKGETTALINSKYKFESKNIIFLKKIMELKSENKTIITDNSNLYNLSSFKYLIDTEVLKGKNIVINSNYKLPKNDKFYFSSAIIDLKNQNFIAKDTVIEVHKNIFDNFENDPRIKGISSKKNGQITTINKGVFTSCKKSDNCPPWAIQANEIRHDRNKNEISYKNAILKIYDIPVLYFPKFFHPDPTVERKSGILKPVLNNSNVLGSSLTVPYFHVISNDSDLTFAPTIFDDDKKFVQNEYRKVGKKYNLTTNFGHIRDYKSSLLNKNKNLSYLFTDLDLNLDLENFKQSNLTLKVEKVYDDSLLKLFDTLLLEETTSLKPSSPDNLSNDFKIFLDHENYSLTAGFQAYENLQKKNSDRYEYVLPYYEFNKVIFSDFKYGGLSLNSSGNNNLKNTNQLKSQIINDISFSSYDYFSSNGFKNSLDINIKNLNSVGKNVSDYKSSPQIEISSIFDFQTSYPLKKQTKNFSNFLTPKLSLRINPSDMKNYTSSERTITTDNIFSLDRLGLSDTFESGKSVTMGLNYKKEMLSNINKYFEIDLATVIRDKEEKFIPKRTTLNQKNSNIFGSVTNNFSDKLKLNYKFALEQNLDEIQYNDVNATISLNNLVTKFNFIKKTNDMGDESLIENVTSYNLSEKSSIKFNTRRNRKLNLTEFYDLIYEYKNDCLIAGIKYKKTYYEDKDVKPSEDFMFTVTLFPLTTYEQKIDK